MHNGPEGVRFQRVRVGGESRFVTFGRGGLAGASVSHLSDGRPVLAVEFDGSEVRTRVGKAGVDPNTPGA